ncbi:MAG: hypothetical protein U9O98_08835, partial [Asgard group archaeon]|nr:hypothetical protein [Asgard group archaeon]
TNTSGLLSTIFMINMQYRFTKLNKAANSFGAIQLQVCEGLQEIIEKMQTGTKQLHYSMNNFSDVTNDLQTIQYKLESLEIEHYPKNKR